MTEIQSLTERVAQLEVELAGLRRELAEVKSATPPPSKNWLDSVAGSFADCPEFDEVIRLGAEWREADRKASADANYE